jgi:hypothetical protein
MLPVIPYIYIYYSYYLISTYRIALAINKVIYYNTYFAYLLTFKSYTRIITIPFSIDTLLILQISPTHLEPYSSFTYPIAVRSLIVTRSNKLNYKKLKLF